MKMIIFLLIFAIFVQYGESIQCYVCEELILPSGERYNGSTCDRVEPGTTKTVDSGLYYCGLMKALIEEEKLGAPVGTQIFFRNTVGDANMCNKTIEFLKDKGERVEECKCCMTDNCNYEPMAKTRGSTRTTGGKAVSINANVLSLLVGVIVFVHHPMRL